MGDEMKVPARIALIHAVQVAMEPTHAAMRAGWPEAELVNLLDDSLSLDRAKETSLSATLTARILDLARHAVKLNAAGILFTCSAFGPAIEQAAEELPIPVLKPNESMFEAAFALGDNFGMLATFRPAVAAMEAEFAEEARRRQSAARLKTITVPEARIALDRGDFETHDRLLAERAPELAGCDAILLAHFSTARAIKAVSAVLHVPVLSSPDSAVAKLRSLLDRR
jgi:Asp/Glu/hydantoin racemase